MGKTERGFIPIDEATTDRVRFAVDLPSYLDRSKVRAHSPRIENMMGIGGISHLRVETFEEDRVTTSPTIVGFNRGGEAYSGKIAKSSKSEDLEIENSKLYGNPMVDATVKLDVQALSRKIVEKDLRSAEAWAHEIDLAVLKGLRSASVKPLLKDNIPFDIWYKYLGYGFGRILVTAASGENSLEPERLASSYGLSLPLFYALHKFMFRGNHRFSFVWGPQVDRWALLQVKSRLKHVVKAEK